MYIGCYFFQRSYEHSGIFGGRSEALLRTVRRTVRVLMKVSVNQPHAPTIYFTGVPPTASNN